MGVASRLTNSNRVLRQLGTLITDGRYPGTTFCAAVGHTTPEAIHGGGIAFLQTGDLLQLRLRTGRIDLLDKQAFVERGAIEPYQGELSHHRAALAMQRKEHLQQRALRVAPSNRMLYHTDAAHGVVPLHVAEWAAMLSNPPQPNELLQPTTPEI